MSERASHGGGHRTALGGDSAPDGKASAAAGGCGGASQAHLTAAGQRFSLNPTGSKCGRPRRGPRERGKMRALRGLRAGRALSVVTASILGLTLVPAVAGASAASTTGDFNRDGRDDLAAGAPLEDRGAISNAGAVNVIYGSPGGLSATATPDRIFYQGSAGVPDSPESDDQFGRTLAVGDFDGDGFDDLAVGAPREDRPSGAGQIVDAGTVTVIYGSPNGLSTSAQPGQIFHQDSPGVADSAEDDDRFGGALASGDFNTNGKDDLAVGAIGEDTGLAATDAGLVHVLYASSSGVTASNSELVTQDTPGVVDQSEAGDQFGMTLAAGDFSGNGADDLAVGAPYEGFGMSSEVGAVNVLYGKPGILPSGGIVASGNELVWQNAPGIVGNAEGSDRLGLGLAAGDVGGDASADLAIGVPAEGLDPGNNPNDAGGVNVVYGAPGGLTTAGDQFVAQGRDGVGGGLESFDFFGLSLAVGNFNGNGRGDLAIGAPSEDVGAKPDAGGVNVIYSSGGRLRAAGPPGDQFYTQDSAIADSAETGDRFGQGLAAGDFDGKAGDDLAAGVPAESAGTLANAGAVNVIYSKASGLSAAGPPVNRIFRQGAMGVNGGLEADDAFGAFLAPGGSTGLDPNLTYPP